jgi:hypothetical protein
MKKSKNVKKKPNQITAKLIDLFTYLHNYVNSLNNSKLFAGLMIIVLNVASRFVTVKLSKSMESYLKYTFSRQVLIFSIAWMGTRDIYISLVISFVFMFCMDYLFNEDSQWCILPSQFMNYHIDLWDKDVTNIGSSSPSNGPKPPEEITKEQIVKAYSILEKAKQQLGVDSEVNKNVSSSN